MMSLPLAVPLRSCQWDLGPAVDRAAQKMWSVFCVPASRLVGGAGQGPLRTLACDVRCSFWFSLRLPQTPLLWASGSLADLAEHSDAEVWLLEQRALPLFHLCTPTRRLAE